jgi:hypothetical protein
MGKLTITGRLGQESWVPLMVNANDGTNEGIIHSSKPWFSAPWQTEFRVGWQVFPYFPRLEWLILSVKKRWDHLDSFGMIFFYFCVWDVVFNQQK